MKILSRKDSEVVERGSSEGLSVLPIGEVVSSLVKKLIMRARSPDIGLLTDEEAERLIAKLDLKNA